MRNNLKNKSNQYKNEVMKYAGKHMDSQITHKTQMDDLMTKNVTI